MTHAFVNIIIPIAADRADPVDQLLETYFRPLQDHEGRLRKSLSRTGLHFMSITVVRGEPGAGAHLVIEGSVDGGDATFFAILNDRLGADLAAILKQAAIAVEPADLAAFLRKHQVRTGQGLFDIPGLDFTGTPGMSVPRILDEATLARDIRTLLDAEVLAGSPLANLRAIRARIAADAKHASMLAPEPVTVLPAEGGSGAPPLGLIIELALRGLVKFFWPVLVVLIGAIAAITAMADGWASGVVHFFAALFLALLVLGALLGFVYARLRALEAANQPDNSLPDPAILEDVVNHEDWAIQNHLAGVSIMQAGLIRRLTLRIAFWVVLQMAVRRFRPGFLSEIGTIHFARWILLPNTDRLLFFSNYGGSWGSYLEDFITKAANGLTGVWSNTIGFPQSQNLFQAGATDGERFKRWARRQQRPTRFWYSAYPRLTTARIRANAAIRQGLISASTEDEAQAWFTLIGSSTQPATTIETSEVQTLFFGGLKYHPFATSLLVALPEDVRQARAFLEAVTPKLTFGESPIGETARILGLSARGLARLGVDAAVLGQFPAAFRFGMAHPSRQHLLADTGDDKPEFWAWGGPRPVDAVLNVYCTSAAALARALADIEPVLGANGVAVISRIAFEPDAAAGPGAAQARPGKEPFGFADGISQPIVRGTKRWTKASDAIHTVEPGEFLLGYPDNRGYLPLSPSIPASADPANCLPVAEPRHSLGRLQPNFSETGANADRDFGRNGSYLVVRQLEQDVARFDAFLADAAERLAGQPGLPDFGPDPAEAKARLAHWIGAKMVGRWRDGTSLTRFPNRPGSGWDGGRDIPPDNDFLHGAEDPAGQRCPYGAHIRRAFPRESLQPGSSDQLAIVNRHRILRRGRAFKPGAADAGTPNGGLFFMCLNSDIERQFEFIQQTWAMALQFHGLENEVDPILGRGGAMTGRLTIPTDRGPVMLKGVKDFVRVRGGEYFFMPGKRTLAYISR